MAKAPQQHIDKTHSNIRSGSPWLEGGLSLDVQPRGHIHANGQGLRVLEARLGEQRSLWRSSKNQLGRAILCWRLTSISSMLRSSTLKMFSAATLDAAEVAAAATNEEAPSSSYAWRFNLRNGDGQERFCL